MNKRNSISVVCSALFLLFSQFSFAQGTITGNMESTYQYLLDDTLIGAVQPNEKSLVNSYMNVNYRLKGFKAGLRAEAYLPRILGYPDRFDGAGIGYRYIGYENDLVDVTLGNFYDQFGSGLLFRAYEDRALGVDNSMNGFRLKLKPYKGVTIKGVYGKQRFALVDGKVEYGEGIVRGIDGEINLNSWFEKLEASDWRVAIGGSFVSKFQKDDNPALIMPENTGSYGGRFDVGYKKFFLNGEYVIKEQDPSTDNGLIYNYGKGALINAGYSKKGLGILLSAKSIDNMSYRSDRNASLQDLTIGFIPPLTKTHTYNLVATLYPYASQPNGEVAYQADLFYKIKKGSKLGGKYGTDIAVNFSTAYQPERDTSNFGPTDSTRVTYESRLFASGGLKYWQDFNVSISRKLNKKWKVKLNYYNIQFNNDVQKVTNAKGIIYSHIGVAEVSYKINRKNSIRAEFQGLWTEKDKNGIKKDRGDWATVVIEYNISPGWFFSGVFQSNYGNPLEEDRINYPIVVVGKIWGATRLQASYGRQNAGLFCVGGVCRFVPASNGLTLSFTHTF